MSAVKQPAFTLGQNRGHAGGLGALGAGGRPAGGPHPAAPRSRTRELCDEDHESNKRALRDGSRIFSSFRVGREDDHEGEKLSVITEAADDDGVRASTCILLPEDY